MTAHPSPPNTGRARILSEQEITTIRDNWLSPNIGGSDIIGLLDSHEALRADTVRLAEENATWAERFKLVSEWQSLDQESLGRKLARIVELEADRDRLLALVEHQPTLRSIQRVNHERANRWHNGDMREWTGLEWAGAMCGEAGEAANVAKKLRRVELAYKGNEFSEHPIESAELVAALANECADTFAYLALLASRYGIDLESAVIEKFNRVSEQMGFPERILVRAPSSEEP